MDMFNCGGMEPWNTMRCIWVERVASIASPPWPIIILRLRRLDEDVYPLDGRCRTSTGLAWCNARDHSKLLSILILFGRGGDLFGSELSYYAILQSQSISVPPPQNEEERRRRAQAEAHALAIQQSLARASQSVQVWSSVDGKNISSTSLRSQIPQRDRHPSRLWWHYLAKTTMIRRHC
jgi:hypothetical protein